MKYALAILTLFGVISAAAQEASPLRLTLAQSQEMALKLHPAISVAALTALAAQQNVKAVHSAMLPSIFGHATAVGAADPNNTRIAAGGLNNPLIYSRQADGATISQLITDFGRMPALTESARAQQRAAEMNTQATRAQILLEVNNGYFSALESQAVLQVAQETLQARQLVLEQTEALATNRLKSDLDVSFARVDYDQASILLAKARSDLQASFAILSAALGEPRPAVVLVDEPMASFATNSFSALLSEALGQRPDLAQFRYQRDAAQQMAKAESRLAYPTVSAIGAAGLIPAGNSHLSDDYAAAGIDLSIPLLFRRPLRRAAGKPNFALTPPMKPCVIRDAPSRVMCKSRAQPAIRARARRFDRPIADQCQ